MPRLRSRAPETNPCAEVVYWGGAQIALTRVAVSHLRRGDALFGINSVGETFRRTVTDVVTSTGDGSVYVYVNTTVRTTSQFPLSSSYRTDIFIAPGDMIISAHLSERTSDA